MVACGGGGGREGSRKGEGESDETGRREGGGKKGKKFINKTFRAVVS